MVLVEIRRFWLFVPLLAALVALPAAAQKAQLPESAEQVKLTFAPLVKAVSPAVVNHLLRESRGMVRNFVLTVERGPALDESTVRANRERIERGDTQRAIYPADVLTTLAGQRWLGVWAEAGEDQPGD